MMLSIFFIASFLPIGIDLNDCPILSPGKVPEEIPGVSGIAAVGNVVSAFYQNQFCQWLRIVRMIIPADLPLHIPAVGGV
jgi:hypothetical protein